MMEVIKEDKMEYQATYGIDCAVSPGFGVKYPDYARRTEKIFGENDNDALKNSLVKARTFADDYLSNPETGLTTVQLLSLVGSHGDVSFDASKAVVKRSMLEHILKSG